MPLFICNNNKLTSLNILPLGKEKELQRLIEKNLQEVLDIHFIDTEHRTSTGRIDTLGVDGSGAPVIIEYKRNKNDNVINQALSYLKGLKAQRSEYFEMLVINKLGKDASDNIRIDWKHPRIVCIAEAFSQYDIDTVEVLPLRIELFKYKHYEHGLFSLDRVTVNERQKNLIEAYHESPPETNLAIIAAMKDQVSATPAIRKLFDELREQILSLDEYIIEKGGKRSLAYRLTKNFAEVLIRRDKLVIELRPIDYVDPRGKVEKLAEGYVVTMNRRVTLSEPGDLDYVMGIIEQSYQNVL